MKYCGNIPVSNLILFPPLKPIKTNEEKAIKDIKRMVRRALTMSCIRRKFNRQCKKYSMKLLMKGGKCGKGSIYHIT
jgi:hypothetical protein